MKGEREREKIQMRMKRKGKNRLQLQPRPFWGINFKLQLRTCLRGELILGYSYRRALFRNFKCNNYCPNGS